MVCPLYPESKFPFLLPICFISVLSTSKLAVPESLFDPQVNGEVLGTVTSQFIRYSFDLPSLKGLNRLEVGAWTNGDDIQREDVDVDTGLFHVYSLCSFIWSAYFWSQEFLFLGWLCQRFRLYLIIPSWWVDVLWHLPVDGIGHLTPILNRKVPGLSLMAFGNMSTWYILQATLPRSYMWCLRSTTREDIQQKLWWMGNTLVLKSK